MNLKPLINSISKFTPAAIQYYSTGKSKPFALSIDVTAKCNLRCKTCYVYQDEVVKWEMNKIPEQSHEHKIQVIQRLKTENPNAFLCTIIGGEPLMPNVAEPLTRQITELFPLNWIVTNGTFPIPNYDSNKSLTSFFISLDGIETHHDNIRGRGVFAKAMKNVENSTSRVYAHSVITHQTVQDMESLVDFLYKKTRLRGIRFSMYTPTNGDDSPLRLVDGQRYEALNNLRYLKNKFGSFVNMSRAEIECFDPNKINKVFGDNCILPKGGCASYDYEGIQKEKCVMGAQADCSQCGCAIPTIYHSILEKKSLPALTNLVKTFI